MLQHETFVCYSINFISNYKPIMNNKFLCKDTEIILIFFLIVSSTKTKVVFESRLELYFPAHWQRFQPQTLDLHSEPDEQLAAIVKNNNLQNTA